MNTPSLLTLTHYPPQAPFPTVAPSNAGGGLTYSKEFAYQTLHFPVALEAQRPHSSLFSREHPPTQKADSPGRPPHDLSGLPTELRQFLILCAYNAGVPKISEALSLDELRENPEKFRGQTIELCLYDVDGTLVHDKLPMIHGQRWAYWLGLDLLRFDPGVITSLLHPSIVWETLVGAGTSIKRDLKEGKKIEGGFVEKVVQGSLTHIEEKGLRGSLRRFSERFGHINLVPFVVEHVLRDAAEGRVPLFLSASPEDIVEPLAASLGVDKSNVRGTRVVYDSSTGKVSAVHHLHGHEKVTGIGPVTGIAQILKEFNADLYKKLGIKVVVRKVMTDSASDRDLLKEGVKAGGEIFAINPRAALLPYITGGYKTDADPEIAPQVTAYIVHEEDGTRTIKTYGAPRPPQASGSFPLPPSGKIFDGEKYATTFSATALGLALGNAPALAIQAFQENQPVDVLATAASIAAGALTAMAGRLFIPEPGEITKTRDSFLRDIAPLIAFMGADVFFGALQHPLSTPAIPWALSKMASAFAVGALTGRARRSYYQLRSADKNQPLEASTQPPVVLRRSAQVLLTQALTNVFNWVSHFF